MTDFPRIPALSDDENDLARGLLRQLDDKATRNLLRASYYDGKRAVHQVGSVIPPQYYRLALVLGWSAKAVDLLQRRCNLERFVWPDGDLDGLGASQVWNGNNLRREISSAMKLSLMFGTSFLVNTRGDTNAGETAGLIHVKDALSATGTWNPRRRGLDNLLSVTARNDEGRVTGLALYLDGLTITAERDFSGWSVDRSYHPWGVPAEPLTYQPDASRPLGRSRISRALMALHDAGLRTIIRMEGHADVYSFPEMWLLGADEGIFKNPDGSQKAAWQVMLGRIKAIPDDEDATTPRADVKQFRASSPEPHLAQLNAQAKMFAREASLPDTSLAITDIANPTSAESYDASQNEMIAEAEGAVEEWAPSVQRVMLQALAMANGLPEVPPQWATIEPEFRSPRFQSRAAQADAGMKQIAAAPWLAETEVGLQLLGLSEQQIRLALAERRRLGGSAALRAITEAATAGRRGVTVDGRRDAG